jgi:hypothetical protein
MRSHLLDLPLVERVRTVHSAAATQRIKRQPVNVYRLLLVASVLLNILLWLR